MSATLNDADRGATRQRLGVKSGNVVEIDLYSDAQIAEWDAADRLEDGERERIVGAVTGPGQRRAESTYS
ncbi:MAG: hypothetical protein F4X99_09415 [Gammaproteobacteria bacterium]|nr:hypothetical protein [Gammaproteobacteria bacterium]